MGLLFRVIYECESKGLIAFGKFCTVKIINEAIDQFTKPAGGKKNQTSKNQTSDICIRVWQ
ncbi:MAG: hypothetical protein ABIN01_04225 [Ferruginibacter sp.]